MEATGFRRQPNSGSFKKGFTPPNKGKKGVCSRPGQPVEKGCQGFKCREVVMLNPDGTLRRRFASVKAACQWLGIDRHSVSDACMGKSLCRGFKLMYGEDYVPSGDYHYSRPRGRDIYGRCTDGTALALVRRSMSAETKRRLAEGFRRRAKEMNRLGLIPHRTKPVICLTDGKRFPSIDAAGKHYGLNPANISWAMSRQRKVHGLQFIADWEEMERRKSEKEQKKNQQ